MYALTVSTKATTCRMCGNRQPPGIIRWCFSGHQGALCDACLIEKAPELGAVLIILHLAREVGAADMADDAAGERERLIYLHTACLVYEKKATWPRRGDVLEELQEMVERMEKLHGTVDA